MANGFPLRVPVLSPKGSLCSGGLMGPSKFKIDMGDQLTFYLRDSKTISSCSVLWKLETGIDLMGH